MRNDLLINQIHDLLAEEGYGLTLDSATIQKAIEDLAYLIMEELENHMSEDEVLEESEEEYYPDMDEFPSEE